MQKAPLKRLSFLFHVQSFSLSSFHRKTGFLFSLCQFHNLPFLASCGGTEITCSTSNITLLLSFVKTDVCFSSFCNNLNLKSSFLLLFSALWLLSSALHSQKSN